MDGFIKDSCRSLLEHCIRTAACDGGESFMGASGIKYLLSDWQGSARAVVSNSGPDQEIPARRWRCINETS
jgi:hypothetical protein